jgi:hypothetical protein
VKNQLTKNTNIYQSTILIVFTLFLFSCGGSGGSNTVTNPNSNDQPDPITIPSLKWTWVSPLPTGTALNSISWNGARYVSVGDYGLIMNSTDGTNWNTVSFDTNFNFLDIVWTGNLFIAVGDAGLIATSTDGINWIKQPTITNQRLSSIVWTGSFLTAVGTAGTVITSTNGINWVLQTSITNNNIRDVTWSGSTLVAIDGGNAYLSTDGVSWSIFALTGGVNPISITFVDSQYIASGNNTIMTSVDGISWSIQVSNLSGTIYDFTWDGEKYIGVGIYGVIVTSPDGITWNEYPTTFQEDALISSTNNTLKSVLYNNATLIAVGNAGHIVNSPDGISWMSLSSAETTLPLNSIAKSTNGYVIAGYLNILSSTDGVSWSKVASPINNAIYNDIIWTGSIYVSVGYDKSNNNGIIVSSTNGTNWTLVATIPSAPLWSVTWTGTQFVAVGTSGTVLSSDDGQMWSSSSSVDSSIHFWGVEWDGTQLYGVASNGLIYTALNTNSLSWTLQQSGTTDDIRDIVSSDASVVAVGEHGTILKSTSSGVWTSCNVNTDYNLKSVTWNGERYYLTATIPLLVAYPGTGGSNPGIIMSSEDGCEWVEHNELFGPQISSLLFETNSIYAVGSGGAILNGVIN